MVQHKGRVALIRLTRDRKVCSVKMMDLAVHIPDDIAGRMSTSGDLSRRALEAILAGEYRQGHLNKPDLRRLLGFETSYEIDGFLKAHGVYDDFTMEDLERDLADLKSLGF